MRARLNEDLKVAMRDKDQPRLATLRLILAALKEVEISKRTEGGDGEVTDEIVTEVLAKMVKQRRDSVKMYEEGGRVDLAERERTEIKIIQSYLPQPLSAEEVEQAARAVTEEIGADGLKDMGRCMNVLKSRYAGRIDMGEASQIMKQLLT